MGDNLFPILRMRKTKRTIDVETDVPDFNSLMLSRTSLTALAKAGFTKPSPVQAQAIPCGLLGLDLLVQAKSGTGKTMVFSLLALENLNAQFGRPQVLIVAPTREIVSQIVSYISMLAPPVIHVRMFVGGNEKGVAGDIQVLKKSVHIVVGTTGRLCHLVRINALNLSHIRLFVVDEADKLMESNFQEEINYLFSALPPHKQVAVFSATYPQYMLKILARYMTDAHPVLVDTDAQLYGVKQYVVLVCNKTKKISAIIRLLLQLCYSQCIIFVNDQTKCDEVYSGLTKAEFGACQISGNMLQTDRTNVMKQFRKSVVKILVSTDLTGRGIDVPGVNVVINYGSPFSLSTYLHRIGRSGRFGTHGASFTFINDRKSLKTFSDIAVEGKLRLKVLDLSNRWPNDLIYNEEFFDRSQDFCPYAMQNLHILQDYDGEIKNESSSSVVFNNSNHLLGNEATSKCINNVINSNPKFNKATYSNSDLLKIFASIKTAEISNVLLEKLAALKIVSSHTYDEARDINLKMLDTIVIKDRETELTAAGIKNRSHNKRRYLRKQILAVQNILSAEDWSFYAKIRFPSLSKQELFSKSNCVEPCSVDCLISKEFTSKLSCIDLQKQSVKPYKENAFKKSLVSEKSEDWKKKLIKINSKFFNEMFLKMNKYKEVAVSTEENQTVSVSIQTEEQLIRNSTNLTGDIYLIDDDMAYEDCKNKFSHEFRLMQDNIHQIEDYMTHILSSKF